MALTYCCSWPRGEPEPARCRTTMSGSRAWPASAPRSGGGSGRRCWRLSSTSTTGSGRRSASWWSQRSEAGKASALKRQETRSTSVGTESQPSTPSLYTIPKEEGGDDRPLPDHALGRQVLSIIGADRDPSCRLDHSRVSAWLRAGATADEILSTVQRVTAHKKDGLPSSLKYFDKAIARTVQDRTDPLPAVERTSGRAKSREDRWLAGLNAAR